MSEETPQQGPSQDKPPETEKPKLIPPKGASKEPKDTPPKTQSSRPRGRPPSLETRIKEFYQTVGLTVGFISMEDGIIITQHAEECARAWSTLAAQDKRVKEAWEFMLTGNAWGGVIISHAPVIYGIAKNHGIMPELSNPFDEGRPDGDTPPAVG